MGGIVSWQMLEIGWPALVQGTMEDRVTFVEHTGKGGSIIPTLMNTKEKFTGQFVSQGVIAVPVSTKDRSK